MKIGIAVGGMALAGLALAGCATSDKPKEGSGAEDSSGTSWKGSTGFLKEETHVSGTRDAASGAFQLQFRYPTASKLTLEGAATADGWRAAVSEYRYPQSPPAREISASGDDGGFVGSVTTKVREVDESGERIDTTLTKARFETAATADGWRGTVTLADSDERIHISGSRADDRWNVTIERPDNPYLEHTEYKGKGDISVTEQVAMAVADVT